MVKKILLRICLFGLFYIACYLIDAYVKKDAHYVALAVGMLTIIETTIIMFKNYDKY